MKDMTASIIGIMFTAAFITFTGMGMIPVEAFVGVAGLAIGYWFKGSGIEKWLKRR